MGWSCRSSPASAGESEEEALDGERRSDVHDGDRVDDSPTRRADGPDTRPTVLSNQSGSVSGAGSPGEGGDYDATDISQAAKVVDGVNPTNGTENCSHCALATDERIGGESRATALGDDAARLRMDQMAESTRSKWSVKPNLHSAVQDLKPGQRGIVYVSQGRSAHVFNVAKDDAGNVRIYDGQSGYTGRDLALYQEFSGYVAPDDVMLMVTGESAVEDSETMISP